MRLFKHKLSFIHLAAVSISLLPKLIAAQAKSEARSYFSTIVQSNSVYIIGGSDSTLQVPSLNFTEGIDINNPMWYNRDQSSSVDTILKPYEKGVAFAGANGQVFVQGGSKTSTQLQNLMSYSIESNAWSPISQMDADRPAPEYMMSAVVDPGTNIAYYYGGVGVNDRYAEYSKTFTSFDTNTHTWTKMSPKYPNAVRPGRISHSANIINGQMFILGGVTDGANTTTKYVQADLESVLIYDISTDTAMSVATLGDIPPVRQAFSTVLGLDGKSIVLFGGYATTPEKLFEAANNDIYVLDTCTLTWRKQSVGGTPPGPLYAHGAVNINNYMVVMMGKTSESSYNENVYILDMNKWKWVNSFDANSLGSTIAAASCKFDLPSVESTNFYQFNYDYGVIDNPLRPKKSDSKSKGFGIGFGLLALILIVGGAFWFMRRRRVRKNNPRATLNPRWMRNIPSTANSNNGGAYGDERDYPLFVYNKELDNSNPNNPNRNTATAFAPQSVRTYTASDHEQWEQQLNQEAEQPNNGQTTTTRHNDIWQRMHGLNNTTAK